MFLSRFGVKNYKCLGDIGIPLTPVHVLIGPNDAGKTSLMEAIAALCGSLKRPVKEFFPKPWKGRELVRFGAKELAVRGFRRMGFGTNWPGSRKTGGGNQLRPYRPFRAIRGLVLRQGSMAGSGHN